MADGFIVRRGGAGGGLQALAPTINIVSVGFGDVTFTITNNDPEPAVVRYRLDNIEDLGEIIELAGNTTSTNLTFTGLTPNNSYIIFANSNVAQKVKSETAQQQFDTDFIDEGLIVMWFGQSNEVPSGFALCDGTNGTPDLRNRFMVGAGDEYTIGDTGGFVDTVIVEHSHSASVSSFTGTHTHGIGINSSSGSDNSSFVGTDDSLFSGGMSSGAAGNHTHTVNNLAFGNAGESGTGKNIPPYRALFYIIKEAN